MLTILRSVIQPQLDNCSQLWSPRNQGAINKIEGVQRKFISSIKDSSLANLNYWERLSHLKVLSQERRRERAQILFIWKISQDMVSGYSLNWSHSERRGRFVIPKAIKLNSSAKVKNARERSLAVHGARLFNLLPAHLRNENSGDLDLFKNHLDIFLSTVPDQPTTNGLSRAANSNSLLDQIHFCE